MPIEERYCKRLVLRAFCLLEKSFKWFQGCMHVSKIIVNQDLCIYFCIRLSRKINPEKSIMYSVHFPIFQNNFEISTLLNMIYNEYLTSLTLYYFQHFVMLIVCAFKCLLHEHAYLALMATISFRTVFNHIIFFTCFCLRICRTE